MLVERGLAESRAKARAAIEAGGVKADGLTVAKASELLESNSALEVVHAHTWVGCGALKLLHALETWPVMVDGRVVLDLGASTGGFTEVCLSRGAAKVYAVDVGRGQLHARLVVDSRVVSLEATDARDLTPALIGEPPQLIVADLSFIGLEKALPAALALAGAGADLVVLVKPQFEVGPDRVGKGGIVPDPAARAEAVEAVKGFVEAVGWSAQASVDSPVQCGDGNREILLWARKRPPLGRRP